MLENINIMHGVAKNVSLDLVYVPAHKPYLILIVHREIIVLGDVGDGIRG